MKFRGIATIGRLALIASAACLTQFDDAPRVAARSTTQTAAQSAGQFRELRQTYDLTPNGAVSIYNTSGYIRVTSWNESRVRVDAVKRGDETGPVEVQVIPGAGRLDIRTIYPRPGGSRVSVDYDIKVPRGAALNAQTTNGEITVNDLVARVTANSTNGPITVREVAGDAELTSTNGQITTGRIGGSLSITATNGNMVIGEVASTLSAICKDCNITARGLRDDAKVQTSNGSIELERIGGRVNAEARNGRIRVNDVGGDVVAKSYSNSVMVTNARGYVVATTLNGDVVVRNAGEGARASSVSGSVEISDSKGRIEADATNGSITLNNIAGKDVIAKSTNSSVVFTGRLSESGRYVFFSANANVTLTLPSDSNFNLTIKSDNGPMNTEFPLKLGPGVQLGRGPIVGVVGKGGPEVSAISNNGAVRIKKAP